MIKKFAVAAAAIVLASSGAAANDGDDYKFVLVNNSSVSVVAFQANGGDGWSKNWLTLSVKPGQTKALAFSPNATKACEVPTRVTFDDDSKFENPVDFCGVDRLVVTDKKMWTE